MAENISRSWFAVFPYPEKHGYNGTPEEIIKQMQQEWIADNPNKKGFWAYCISEQGMPHIHMILEGSGAMRFSAVKKAYPKAHLEATKGTKKQILAYIKKDPPFDEKGEKVICTTSYGNIEGYKRFPTSTLNNTLSSIEEMIERGMTPNAIMEEDIRFRREESLIRKAYFAKRYKETPPIRKIDVVWHLGESGTGKSFSYVQLCELHGEENIYFFSDYANKGIGGFDAYMGEPILFMDELKGNSLPFEMLLTLLQGYRTQIHCRYANCYALWIEVHISTIYPPEYIYAASVSAENYDIDTITQLLRRISLYVYHYIEDGEYKTFELQGKDYINYEELKKRVPDRKEKKS